MEQELKLKKRGVSGVVVFLLIILFLAAGLVGGWYVGKENLIKIGTDKEEKEEKNEEETEETEELKVGECLNCKEGNKYLLTESGSGFYFTINSDMKSVTIEADLKEINSIFGLQLVSLDGNEHINKITVDGFDKKITQVTTGVFGHAASEAIIYYVMEDGTIEYTPIRNELNDNWNKDNSSKLFKTRNSVKNVDNVSYITGATVESGTTGYITTVAVKKDGSYYDLKEIINK